MNLGYFFLILLILFIIFNFFSSKNRIKRLIKKSKALSENGKKNEAILYAKEALSLNKSNIETVYFLTLLFAEVEKYKEGINILEEYIQNDQDDQNTQFKLAYLYSLDKNFTKAISILQSFPKEFDKNLHIINLLATCFYEKGEFELAVEVLKNAPLRKRDLDNELIMTHYLLGKSYQKLDDKKNALKHFRKIYAENIGFMDIDERIEILKEN